MFIIIGFWGSRERKIRAAYLLFFYTVCGSIFFLISILYIYSLTGTLDYESFFNFSFKNETFIWFGFFLSFASKIPMFPFHIWLPEAHVEAPTVGSVLLAGILLKLGVYGFLRYSLVLFKKSSFFFSPMLYVISLLGIILASLSAIRQTDLKRIIAYSSIAHMNLIILGLFSYNEIGYEGCILQSVSHGFVSGALFFLIGILYTRYHSRLLFYYSGVVHMMPLYSGVFLVFILANIALPGTSSFVGEFTILLGIFKISILSAILAATSVILSGAYSLWLYNRMFFGNLKFTYIQRYKDLTGIEFLILFPLLVFVLFIGIYPNYFFKTFSFITIKNLFFFSKFVLLCN
jgi:proton-translocating NADH-quinone oxidoreductase chain M